MYVTGIYNSNHGLLLCSVYRAVFMASVVDRDEYWGTFVLQKAIQLLQ